MTAQGLTNKANGYLKKKFFGRGSIHFRDEKGKAETKTLDLHRT